MVCYYGMKEMKYRTTFALDEATIGRLKHLSSVWQTSQAEVVRRSIAFADEAVAAESDPVSSLRELHASGHLLAREEAEEYLTYIREDRQSMRGDE